MSEASAAERYAAIVIGAGAGGLTVAAGLARLGRRVALIEAGAIGGDCTNVGCVPSKLLLRLAADLQRAAPPVGSPERRAAGAAALAEVRRVRDAWRDEEEEAFGHEPNLTLLRGRGRLTPRGVEVTLPSGEVRQLIARARVIATGARAIRIEVPGLPAERRISNEEVFDLPYPPAHLAVQGGGAIGVELATAFAQLGSRVTLIEAGPRLLGGEEPIASETIHAALTALGVDVRVGAQATRYDAAQETLHLSAGAPAVGVDMVLQALGRRPSSDDLVAGGGDLASLGIRRGAAGIATNAAHRTSRAGIYAIGDVTERAKFTHAANAQGRRLVRHLLLGWIPLVPEGDYPSATFTTPEVARIGPPLARLQERWGEGGIATHQVEMANLDRGRIDALTRGVVLLHARRGSGRLLGATVIGPHAGDVLALLTWAQRRGISLWQLARHVAPYPTLGEGIKRAADAFTFATAAALPREIAAYLRSLR
jgi:dihydrolipoamide dehydrogenase